MSTRFGTKRKARRRREKRVDVDSRKNKLTIGRDDTERLFHQTSARRETQTHTKRLANRKM